MIKGVAESEYYTPYSINRQQLKKRKEAYSNARYEYNMYNHMRNVALMSDLAAGVLNGVARKRGSRLSLPMESTSKITPSYVNARYNLMKEKNDLNRLLTEHADYDGKLAYGIILGEDSGKRNEDNNKAVPVKNRRRGNPIDEWGKEHLQGDIWRNYLKNKK